jgi:hypothetical protein
LKLIEHQIFDQERALYGSDGVTAIHCTFDGPADGESAFKECRHVVARNCYFNLRYPFWHDTDVRVIDSELTPLCRAALWYCDGVELIDTQLHGIKALRECRNVQMRGCDVDSAEFAWFVRGLDMRECSVKGEYFLLQSRDAQLHDVSLKGKYSFQYLENATLEHCELDTKDALWHAKNVTVRDCTVKGEYLAWYCENVTFERCRIIGTQPLCYCRGLRLIDCEMIDTDLAFEKSEVEATLTAPILSIKNPAAGCIRVPSVGEILLDDPDAQGKVLVGK